MAIQGKKPSDDTAKIQVTIIDNIIKILKNIIIM